MPGIALGFTVGRERGRSRSVAGTMPIKVPISEPRNSALLLAQISAREMPFLEMFTAERRLPRKTSSQVRKTCESAYKPTRAGDQRHAVDQVGGIKGQAQIAGERVHAHHAMSRPRQAAMQPLSNAPSDRVATMVEAENAQGEILRPR